ncbi:hypothetical protein MACK_000175 [Theileria orientalis]|uniref:Gamma tubulin complex component protein N-terminal domain-containing protein n=1 Tax=Theileria orientalis TaxID=68886 RepID=A0A976QTS6_THEOR|nr:hypothetical protein MACK_000175 [Theileria orientalis]
MSINRGEMKESISKTSLPKMIILPTPRAEKETRTRFRQIIGHKSILYMLYSLTERRIESSNWSAAPENEERSGEDKHDTEESIEENVEQMESENMIQPEVVETYSNSPQVEGNNDNEMSEWVGSENETEYTNEKEVVLDLIYALKGMNTRYLRRANKEYFQVDLKLTNRNRQIVNKICTLSKMYNSIREVELGSSALMDSVKKGLAEEMEDFNKLLDSLLENYDEYSVSLLQLYTLLHKPYRKVKLLYKLVIGGGHVMDNLYKYSTRGDGISRETFTRLLRKGLVPYFETVFKWLYSGELPGEKEYFFVTTEPENGEMRDNSLPYLAGNYGNSTAVTTTLKGNSRKHMNKEAGAVSDDTSKHKEVYENLYFNATKVFKFFPMDLAEDIYERGKLSHCLKRLNRSVNTMTLNSFMIEVFGNEKSLEESFTSLRRLLSELNNSRELATAILEKEGLGEYVSALCIQFTDPDHQQHQYKYGHQHQYRHNHKSLKDDYDMTENVENGIRVYYPNPKFPYNLVIDDYRVYKGMIRVSAMLRAAANSLNESYSEYMWLNRCNNRVLELSKVLNKLNFYRSEMSNFLSSVQPYHNSLYWLSVYRASLCSHHTLRSLRESSRSFTQNLDYRFYSELPPILINVIEFGKSLSELLRQDVRQLHSLNLRGSAKLVHFIDNDMADFASKSLRSAEQFRINVLGLLSRFKGKSLLLDFNEFYKFNRKII